MRLIPCGGLMSLLERIRTDQGVLRRQRNTIAAGILQTVIGACARRAKSLKPERALTDGEVTAVVQAMIKRIDKAILAIENAPEQRSDVDRLVGQRQALVDSLPQRLTDDELEHIAMRQHSIMNYTQILSFLRQHYPGRYD